MAHNDSTTNRTYTTRGNVRGSCGHKHQSIRTAAACLRRDMAGCASQGGYSDRQVVPTDDGEMGDDEFAEISEAVNV